MKKITYNDILILNGTLGSIPGKAFKPKDFITFSKLKLWLRARIKEFEQARTDLYGSDPYNLKPNGIGKYDFSSLSEEEQTKIRETLAEIQGQEVEIEKPPILFCFTSDKYFELMSKFKIRGLNDKEVDFSAEDIMFVCEKLAKDFQKQSEAQADEDEDEE